MYYGILASTDGVFGIHCLLVLYGIVPPVTRLLVVAVMDGGSDACLRPLLVNSIIEKNRFFELRNRFL